MSREDKMLSGSDPGRYKNLIDMFDEKWDRFYNDPKNNFDQGFYLISAPNVPVYPVENNEIDYLPDDGFWSREPFRGYYLLIPSHLKYIYLYEEKTKKSSRKIKVGEEIPGIEHYYPASIQKTHLEFKWGSLKPNYKMARAFIDMYRITQEQKYLNPARKILLYIADRVGEDGLYRMPFPETPLKYRAIYQSYILQLLYEYNRYSENANDQLVQLMDKMGRAFVFSDEGTLDHWLEATIGQVIIQSLGIKEMDQIQLKNDLDNLFATIVRFDGKIPFCLIPCNPPKFRPNYQNYNAMLFAVLQAKYLQKSIGLNQYFPQIFEEAKKNGDARLFRALYYIKFYSDFDDAEFVHKREEHIHQDNRFDEIPILIKYKILEDSER